MNCTFPQAFSGAQAREGNLGSVGYCRSHVRASAVTVAYSGGALEKLVAQKPMVSSTLKVEIAKTHADDRVARNRLQSDAFTGKPHETANNIYSCCFRGRVCQDRSTLLRVTDRR